MSASATEFVHLHVHSEYSLLDGLSRPPEIVNEAKRQGMRAVALTDHGVLHGAIEFYQAAQRERVKPIVGVEAYVAQRRMTDKEAITDRSSAHLVLLAKNQTGYRNLLALVSKAHTDGFYYKPRIDHEALEQHHEGLIALSGCASGEVPWAIRQEDLVTARKTAEWYRALFGPDDYYLELQSHGIEFQPTVNRELLTLAKDLDLKLVCTNDSHYTHRDDAEAQDLLLCIQTNALFDDPKRMRMYTGEHYLKTAEEMASLFAAEAPEALKNTLHVAERCNLELEFGRVLFPKLPFLERGDSADEFLSRLCWENLPRKYDQVSTTIEDRLRYELDVVRTTGFAAYILFVWDFTDFARKKGIYCSPRGSAAGSLILYLIGIATIDPIRYELTFERFLNPERIQLPDIDMDFADSRREEVIDYVAQRYGHDHVAQIVTFGRLLARAAIRDVGRALAYPLTEVDRVAKLIPTVPVGMTIDKSLAASDELQQLYSDEPHIRRLLDLARKVEGISRHASTHAAGVVVSPEPLVEIVPLQRSARGENLLMTQYEMHAVADIGLVKEDFLGLTNLTLLENAIKMIEEVRGQKVDLWNLPENDPKTFEMLTSGDTTGVFQMEGPGMRRTVREFKPSTLDHLAAIVALYRPGPMANIPAYVAAKDGRSPITFLHPKLEPILKDTYGVMVFQDQVLRIVQAVAGFTLGHADVLRNAMGKKIRAQMDKERDNFLRGAEENAVTTDVAEKIWEYIEPFSGYGFNRAHAYCYANIAYQTAYLKCNFPAEYMAAMLSTQYDDNEKVVAATGECRRLGIPVLLPDVNHSHVGFTVEETQSPAVEGPPLQGVRFGLAAVKNVGDGAARAIVDARERDGPFVSLDNLCTRIDLRQVNKRTLEALAKAGALDAFGARERVLAGLDQALGGAQHLQRAASLGQGSLFGSDSGFGGPTPLPQVPAATNQQRLAWEKEAFGFYLANHPFAAAASELAAEITTTTSQISEETAGEHATIAGAVMQVRRVITKKQETMVIARIEDLHGSIEAVVFPRTYAANPSMWREDAILILDGKIDVRRIESGNEESRGVPEILVQAAREWEPAAEPHPLDMEQPTPSSGESPQPSTPSPHAEEGRGEGAPPDARPVNQPRSAAVSSDPDGLVAPDGFDLDFPTSDYEEATALPPDFVDLGVEEESAAGTPRRPASVEEPPAPYLETPEVEPANPTKVAFLVRETGDAAADSEILKRLHATVSQAVGEDPYEIVFEGSGGRRRLVGEHLRVSWTPELASQVAAILGEGAIQRS